MDMQLNQANKHLVWDFWRALDDSDPARAAQAAAAAMAEDVVFHGHDPVNELRGRDAWVQGFWQPLKAAFPGLRRQCHVFLGGASNGRRDGNRSLDGRLWVSGTGVFTATFEHDYSGIPATGRPVTLRWGEFCRVDAGRVVEVYFLLDMIDLLQQAGLELLPPARGADGLWPPPRAADGVLLAAQDEALGEASLDHIWRFIYQGLNVYDQSDLASMGMRRWFHPRVHWYGPGGIGACLDFEQFEQLHQKPWLTAFPDRAVQDLDALIAEGVYSGGPGWAGVIATHRGPYLDCPASGRTVKVNGLDWWKREGDQYIENWVFVDMVHLFRQFGVDLLARAAALARGPRVPNRRGAAVVWLTGLSGAGKSTLAQALARELQQAGVRSHVLDGDELRQGLSRDLGFTAQDRAENVRRAAEAARLLLDAGLVVIVALISPFRVEREKARSLFADGEFIEVHVDVPLEVAEQRDPKGLYAKARRGLLTEFTGIDSPYEPPLAPELRIDAAAQAPSSAARAVRALLAGRGLVPR